MSRDDREIEELLRAALHERADQIVPAGDGLQRIRARTTQRRRFRWLKPSLVALTAAAAAAAVAVLPNVIKTADDNGGRPASMGTLEQSTMDSTSTPTQTPTKEERFTTDKPLAWPYPDERTAIDQGTRAYKALADPQAVAQKFVSATVTSAPLQSGIARTDGDVTIVPILNKGIEVTQVRLAQVVSANVKFYVVERADSPQLTITEAPNLLLLSPPIARGTVKPVPGSTTKVALQPLDGAGNRDFTTIRPPFDPWTAKFNRVEAQAGVVVAWTTAKNGMVSAIAAVPTGR